MAHPVLELIAGRIASGSLPGRRDADDRARLALAIEVSERVLSA